MQGKNVIQALFYILIFMLSSCSATRRAGEPGSNEYPASRNARLLFDVEKNNISKNSFRFDRVRVVFETEGDQKRFSGNIKYDSRGRILLSIRTIGGIEVARVYADGDRVILIDRINRVYMEGNTESLLNKYGLRWDERGIIFGDIPERLTVGVKSRCQDNSAVVPVTLDGRIVLMTVDCKEKKIKELEVSASGEQNVLMAWFSEYTRIESDIFPGVVLIKDRNGMIRLEITYGRYSTLEDEIEIPAVPQGYDKGKLL